ncbi:MAG: methionine biosynthesis protein MetW [Candidatus Aegiribacteria sp.]
MSEARKHGEKGRGILKELFGNMPMPGDTGPFDPAYDDYWDERAKQAVLTVPAIRRTQAILDCVDMGDTVLDIGCGTGETLELLRRERNISGTGLDVSARALERVRGKGFATLNTDITGSGSALDDEWDHIILFEVIEHVLDAEVMVRNLIGRFRKGLYITTPNLGYAAHRLRLAFGRFPVTYMLDPREHIRFWTTKDFKYWSREMGLGTPEVRGLRGKLSVMGIQKRWPSLFASEVLYRFLP